MSKQKVKSPADNTLVPTPIWVLKAKVEDDWSEWHLLNKQLNEDNEDEEDDDGGLSFPEYDSTIQCLEILKKEGINFNSKTGRWE